MGCNEGINTLTGRLTTQYCTECERKGKQLARKDKLIEALRDEVEADERVEWLEKFGNKQDNTGQMVKALERKLNAKAKRLQIEKEMENGRKL